MGITIDCGPIKTEVKHLFGGAVRAMKSHGGSIVSSLKNINGFLAVNTPSDDLIRTDFEQEGVVPKCGIDMLNGICPLCNSSNSCTYDHNLNSFDCPPDSYPPPHPTYETYSGDTCGTDSCFGDDCPPWFPLNYKPEPGYIQNYNSYPHDSPSFPQQYPCCEDCGVTHEPYQCQPKNHDYYYEQNSCYDSTSIGFDQSHPQQYTVNHPVFNAHNEYLDSKKKLTVTLTTVTKQMTSLTFIMGDEHLNTIPATESDEFIKSCVENLVPNPKLVPNPSESRGENECDVPAGFTTFSNVLFNAEYDFDYSDDQSFFNEDLPKKIYSNPLFEEEINPMKIDQHPFNAESDLIESMPNHDSSITISSKIDSLFDEFAGELTLLRSISPGIDETIVILRKKLVLPRDCCMTTHLLDSDSHMEEIDFSFNSNDPMPPGIKEEDYDTRRDILILEELLDNYSISLPDNESYHFDIPSPYRPPAKPPDGKTGTLNIKMMGDVSDQKVPIPELMITRILN
nr:hypothetical protein [Tanacetum cinerariifolium]